MNIREEVFGRVFKKGYIYNFYDSDTRNLIYSLRVWADRNTMRKLVKDYWNNYIANGLDFEEFLEEKGVIYEDIEVEGEFDV